MAEGEIVDNSKKNARKNRKATISFDQETVTKSKAEKIVLEEGNQTKVEQTQNPSRKSKKNKKKPENGDATSEPNSKKKKQSTDKPEGPSETEDLSPDKLLANGKETLRAKKRRRHAELMAEKKINSALETQQKGLAYLSKWKHSRKEWKFEKLRQVWLKNSMYDQEKVPTEFWDTLIEYFNSSRGKIRGKLVTEALEIIEATDVNDETENELRVKYERARSIVQHLQET